ncbi:hypothetical protein [uncultured Kiloniella sp.]|uniref:hypothetical protein n=1 Tax=uncultured Kiloniella sp. TaxID=1133091 RepID=UPI0026224DA4|nr:hypothetical protein [uncultured Kiloniella sp.]
MKQVELDVAVSSQAPTEWNRWVYENSQYAGARQLACRSKLYEIEHDGKSIFLSCEKSKNRVAGALISWIPPQNSSVLRNIISLITGVGNGRLVVFEGPVISEQRFEVLSSLFLAVDDVAKSMRASSITFNALPDAYVAKGQDFWEGTFLASGYEKHDWLTSVVNLQTEEDAYFKSLRAKERNTIRKCQKAGVSMLKCDTLELYLEDFCRNYYEGQWSDERQESCEKQWEHYDPDHFSFFVAKTSDGEVLGTLGTYHFAGYVTVRLINRTAVCRQLKLPVQDFLHWSVMNHHRRQRDACFDLAGVAPSPAGEKEKGIRFFKEKWGGALRPAPSFFKDRRPSWLTLLHKILLV